MSQTIWKVQLYLEFSDFSFVSLLIFPIHSVLFGCYLFPTIPVFTCKLNVWPIDHTHLMWAGMSQTIWKVQFYLEFSFVSLLIFPIHSVLFGSYLFPTIPVLRTCYLKVFTVK